MARPNDVQNLAKLLAVLRSIGRGFRTYAQLADQMECSEAISRRTVEQVCESETDAGRLGMFTIGSPEDLENLLCTGEFDQILARADAASSSLRGSVAASPEVASSTASQAAIDAFCRLGGPGVVFDLDSKLLGRKPRLDFDESWALLMALAFAGVDDDAPLTQMLTQAACPGDFSSRTQMLEIMGDMGDYANLRVLALLSTQHRLAVLEYDSTSSSDSPETIVRRRVLPLELYIGENGAIYLFAYQYAKESPEGVWIESAGCRNFKISRIVDVEQLSQHETSESILSLERTAEHRFLENPSSVARLQLGPDCPFDDRVWLRSEVVGMSGDDAIVEVPLQNDTTWIARSIASKLGEAKVLEPASLDADVRAAASDALAEMERLQAEFCES